MGRAYTSKFIVKPGKKIKLRSIDPGFHGTHPSHKHALPKLQQALHKIDDLQTRMWAERRHSLLIVLQGLDSAGKDGVIHHVITGLNPQGCTVWAFKEPTEEELEHDFLWRVQSHAPAKGTVAVFNRSHYEDVLVARVHKLVPKRQWERRYSEINDFERLLYHDNNTTILKFFLYISKDEQLARFAKRLDDPSHNWKISESDYTERKYWGAYTSAFEEIFLETSTKHAPWFIIPANHKWFCHLAIAQILVEALDDMNIEMPKPTVDLREIRRAYHAAKSST